MQGRNRDAEVEHRPVDTAGEERAGRTERHWSIYITICRINSQWEHAMQHTELNPVLCGDIQRGGMGWGMEGTFKRKGMYVYL